MIFNIDFSWFELKILTTAASFREVAINFRTSTLGVFDVVLPVLEDDEMFNSGMLKDYVGQMISAGRRNIAIDVSPLDYIYSDSMNVLMTANKRAREGGGQIALLKPQAEVAGILQKSGVMGEMRVFAGEGELMAASDEIAAASAYGAPGGQFGGAQSEFESLRSEIGSAFGDDAMQSAPPPMPAPAPMMAPPPMPPPMPMMAPPMPEMMPPPPPPQPMADMAFQPMAMAPAPMPPPPPPKAPAFPPPSSEAYPQETMAFGSIGSHEPPPRGMTLDDAFAAFDDDFAAKKQKPLDDFDDDFVGKKKKKKKAFDSDFGGDFAVGEKKEKPPKKPKKQKDDFSGSDDFEFTTKKKGSPVGAIIVALVVLAIAGGGGYVVMTGGLESLGVNLGGGGEPQAAAKPGAPPALPESAPSEGEAAEAGAPDIPVTTIEVETPKPMAMSTPVPVPGKPAPISGKKQKEKAPPPPPPPQQQRAAAPAVTPPSPPPPQQISPPEPPPPPPPPPKVEQIVITSNPSGAAVEVDGRRVGTTPHTFKPASWGDVNIAVSMNGYERATKTVEFEGGTVNVPFTLSRAAAPPPPPPPPSQPTAQQPPPAPSGGGGSGASIFIATLPPKAEVYIGGRLVGTSNEGELQVPVGTHQVRFVKDGVEKTETLTFGPGKNPTKFVNLK